MKIKDIEVNHLSYSSLKHFRVSPRNFVHYKKQKPEPTDAQIFGDVIDSLVLNPHEDLEDQFLIYEKFDKRSKSSKEKYNELVKQAWIEGKTLITRDKINQALEIFNAVYENENVREVLDNITTVQKKLQWQDKTTGMPILGYADAETYFKGDRTILEVKTTKNGNPVKFLRDAKSMDYPLQAAMYLEGYKRCFYQFPFFLYLIIDTTPPYDSHLLWAEENYLNYGKNVMDETLQEFKYCTDNNLWNKGRDFWLFDTKEYYSTDIVNFFT